MKRKVLYVSPELIAGALTTGHEIQPVLVREGLPPGSRVVGAGMAEQGDVFLLVEHESFPDLIEGQRLEPIRVTFLSQRCPS